MTSLDSENIVITAVNAVVHVKARKGDSFSRKNREGWALSIKQSGTTVYHQNGKTYLSDKEHLVLLAKGSDYRYIIEEPGDCIIIEISLLHEPDAKELCSIRLSSLTSAYEDAEMLEKLWTYKKGNYRLKAMSCVYKILSQTESNEYSYTNSEKYTMIEPAIQYLQNHIDDPTINSIVLAGKTTVSLSYFRKLFMSVYHVPVAAYVESIRIRKAKELLRSDYASVAAVAEAVGYRNIYHFSKTFKKIVGLTPTGYARSDKN